MKKILVILAIFLLNVAFIPISYADVVVYNVKTHKIHSQHCEWAKKCTVNCIKIDRKDAIKYGGIPCKVCGGR